MDTLNIRSEIGKLKSVMLHRPGKELERITPDHLAEVLFEDIPWLGRMQEEHSAFVQELTTRDVQVLFIEDLLEDVFRIAEVREVALGRILGNSCTCDEPVKNFLYEWLNEKSPGELTEFLIGGVSKEEIRGLKREEALSDFVKDNDYFYINPLPNLYFMRDPATVIGAGMSVNSMSSEIRKRESFFMRLIYLNHPLFEASPKELYYTDKYQHSLEGGDLLILSNKTIAVGCSQRTTVPAIEKLASRIFEINRDIENILVIQIPKVRAFMHLDTVFTMLDFDKFTVYPGVKDKMNVICVQRGTQGRLQFRQEKDLESSIKKYLGLKRINLMPSGGTNPITAAREQWNDSTNTLAIAPGKVIAYGRNEVSNKVLKTNGIEVIEIEASELVRGRGGPRCMSMPLNRE